MTVRKSFVCRLQSFIWNGKLCLSCLQFPRHKMNLFLLMKKQWIRNFIHAQSSYNYFSSTLSVELGSCFSDSFLFHSDTKFIQAETLLWHINKMIQKVVDTRQMLLIILFTLMMRWQIHDFGRISNCMVMMSLCYLKLWKRCERSSKGWRDMWEVEVYESYEDSSFSFSAYRIRNIWGNYERMR